MKHTYAVIMAGGGGTRLWPISRKKHPKHVLPLLGERTLFQSTLDRLDGFVPAERILVVTTVLLVVDLEWSDVGSWDSLFDVLLPDERGNVVVNSDHMSLETHGTLVYSTDKKLVVTIGVDDLIVIDSDDALLVCRRDKAQQVRQVIDNLKKTQREDYL